MKPSKLHHHSIFLGLLNPYTVCEHLMSFLTVRNNKESVTVAQVHRESIGKVGKDRNSTLEHFLRESVHFMTQI